MVLLQEQGPSKTSSCHNRAEPSWRLNPPWGYLLQMTLILRNIVIILQFMAFPPGPYGGFHEGTQTNPLVIIPRQYMRFPFFCYLYTTFINVMVTIIIVIAIILLIVLWFVGVQRRLVSSDELCRNSMSREMLSWRGSSGKTASI